MSLPGELLRLTRTLALGAACAAIALPAWARPPATPSDLLADYLESSGLDAQLASLLEMELGSARGERKNQLAQSLTRAYARLLENAPSEAIRAAHEQRARAVLAAVPDADTLELRLTLAHSAYTRAEQAAEQWRLRLNSRADSDAARRSFIELERTLADLASASATRIASLEKQEESATASGPDRALLASALSGTRRTRSLARFLAGWSAYYIGELESAGAADAAALAQRHFGWLLNARPAAAPTIDRVPEQLLTYEHVARAALGVALAESLNSHTESALRWVNLVQSTPGVPESVLRQILARRMIILARAGRWSEIAALVDPRGGGAASSALDPTEARLLAVLALEARHAGDRAADVQPMIVLAFEAMASRGEVSQILDLASKYFDRLDDFEPRHFMASYIRGLREYDRAMRARDPSDAAEDRPAADEPTRRAFAAAARFLNEALESPDAAKHAPAMGGVAFVRALARFFSGVTTADFEQASALFAQAAEKLDAASSTQAARSRFLAVRAIDAAIRAPGAPEARLRGIRRSLVDDYLARHADQPPAAALLFDRALASGRSVRAAARDLLSIPDESPLASAARHQAARLLYEHSLACPEKERALAAEEFLAVAEPLIEDARRTVRPDDAEAASRVMATARRILDCLMRDPVSDPRRAARALDLLTSLIDRGAPATPKVRAEIDYRRMQLAIRAGRWDDAQSSSLDLARHDPSLAPAARRAIYQSAADRWRRADTTTAERAELARRVVVVGSEVIRDEAAADRTLADAAVATLHATVADAASELFSETGETELASLASGLYLGLIDAHPADARFLRAAADHAERTKDDPMALRVRRRLLAGLQPGSPEWFDNKCRVIELLIDTDRDAAQEAIAQHRVLHPELGPEPWRTRLLELERRLATAPTSDPSPPAEGRP